MSNTFDHIESVYWVFTQLCNDTCDHCYNNSGPHGERMTLEECLAVVSNLPPSVGRIILSGGEPLAERKILYAVLEAIQERYTGNTQVMLQTNGDLMTEKILDEILVRGVTRIDVASMDNFHKFAGNRRQELEDMFHARGMSDDNTDPLIEKGTYLKPEQASFGFWGANEDMWLGGNWARGRAMEKDIWLKDHTHNFCAILSGGKGFLGGTELPQEISIQLWKINPCCPGTKYAMGDARTENVVDVLKRVSKSQVFRKINEGDPYGMGETLGIARAEAEKRGEELKNICRWCDEFFDLHYDMETLEPKLGLPVIQ